MAGVAHDGGEQAGVRGLRPDRRRTARREVRRRGPGRRADGGRDRLDDGRGPAAGLHVRRRPRLDRPPLRRGLDVVAAAAVDDRRRRRAAARDAAARCAHPRRRRPRHGRLARRRAGSTSTTTPSSTTASSLLGGEARFRHLYCRAAPSTTCWPPGSPSSGTAPRCSPVTTRSSRGWFGPVDVRRTPPDRRRAGRGPRRLLGDEHQCRSPTRRSWSGCTARSPRPRC